MKRWIFPALLSLCMLAGSAAHARQLSFQPVQQGQYVNFAYSFTDAHQKIQQLQFRLAAADIQNAQTEYTGFDQVKLNTYTIATLRSKADSFPGVDVDIRPNSTGFSMNATGRSQSAIENAIASLKAENNRVREKYLRDNFLIEDTTGKYVLPDHRRIALRYIGPMRPVAQAIRGQVNMYNQRDVINYTMAFLQNIPYDTLESRSNSGGSGFTTPVGLIAGNKGDCDSKSVALASILRNLYPSLGMVILYTPTHALMGIEMQPTAQDEYIMVGNRSFVLSEPVGPALEPLGKTAPSSRADLRRNNYTWHEIPRGM